ncbi:MAG: FkbM family methyltransferase [Saprospiraceae bacterium]|nr:FkbM family methyltransferase [Candidatus Brachybacter algidus]MBK8747255.1 FkbM family methyltransferase [Candidatus Brachybacter algidus]
MFEFIRESLKRRKAKKITSKYPTTIDIFNIPGSGEIKFANWENPLVERKEISFKNIDFFKKFVNVGDFAIDIGGNIGHMTIPLSLAAGKEGTVFSFDPNPYVYEILDQNAKLNPAVTNIKTFNFAISEQEEEFYYNSSEASFCNGGISKEKQSRHGKFALSAKIQGIHLETFLEKNYPELISKIKLIKIDTEGYDKEIIRSIGNLLIKYKPVVITECFKKTTPEQRYEQFNLLKDKGYSLYYFSDFDVNATVIPINKKEEMNNWKHFDLYAIQE